MPRPKDLTKNIELDETQKASQALYDSEIKPLVEALKNKCKEYNMPMFVTVCAFGPYFKQADAEFKSEYTTTINEMLTPYFCNKQIKPDLIADCIKLVNGFTTTLSNEVIDVSEFAVGDIVGAHSNDDFDDDFDGSDIYNDVNDIYEE